MKQAWNVMWRVLYKYLMDKWITESINELMTPKRLCWTRVGRTGSSHHPRWSPILFPLMSHLEFQSEFCSGLSPLPINSLWFLWCLKMWSNKMFLPCPLCTHFLSALPCRGPAGSFFHIPRSHGNASGKGHQPHPTCQINSRMNSYLFYSFVLKELVEPSP